MTNKHFSLGFAFAMTLLFASLVNATNYYASPDGSGDGKSYATPTTWTQGLSKIQAGDSLFLLGGTYSLTAKQSIGTNKSGTEAKHTFIGAYPGEKPVFDFRNQPYGQEETDHDNVGIAISSGVAYVHLKGIAICYTGKSGLVNGGSYCLFENLDVYGCGDTGIQMKAGNNTILNCDSHDNFDYKLGGTTASDFGGNADGFADKKFPEAEGNHYIGCRAWNNSDDGWDFYERISASETVMENCICYANGPASYDMTNHPRYTKDKDWFDQFAGDGIDVKDADGQTVHITLANYTNMGNGNGFKFGGNNSVHNVRAHHCLSVGNTIKGFDQNNTAGTVYLYNNTAYANGYDYGFTNNNGCKLYIQNCISYESKNANVFNVNVQANDHNSWSSGFAVSASDFQSLDKSLILAERNADGSLADNAFMRLTSTSPLIDAGTDVGLPFADTAPDLGCYETKLPSSNPASFAWLVGNEAAATVTSDVASYVSKTKVTTGTGLTVNTYTNYAANPGKTMVTYQPATSNAGNIASVMIEYSIAMKKGATFKLSGVSYDAIKDGTDNASYSWSYTVDGVESAITTVSKDDLLRNNNTTGTPPLRHSETVSATAGQKVTVRFYVSGFANTKKFALSNLQINGSIFGEPETRAFTDFKIDFRDNPRSVILPTTGILPDGVTIEGTGYNGGQHGIYGGTITVPVDGAVKFTLGACQHSKHNITVKKNGEVLTTISNVAPCGEQKPEYNQFITWTYNSEEAATLTFELGNQTYLPYFFAEATDFLAQVEVQYYDTDGKTLIGSETVDGGSELTFKYNASDVTVTDGKAFRGWFDSADKTAAKVPAGTILNEDTKLYAHVTDIEVATTGSIFTYDFSKTYFYPEDHELLTTNGGKFNDASHGWAFANGNSLSIEVAGNALLSVGVCTYSNTSVTDVKDAAGNLVGQLDVTKNTTVDGSEQTIRYTGEATTLTFYFTATNYIHAIKVYNVNELPAKNDAGYYVLSANDGAGLLLTLEMAESGDKIFLPNGTYDFGERVLTPVSKSNVSLIGQSMKGTIIRNAPDYHTESINNTATLLVSGAATDTYLQDLTLQNALDYYTAVETINNGRAIALEDDGTHTICKNVRLLSYQDTYYSHHAGAENYFEDCEIHGTVDYICGNGTVYFKNNLLYNEQRNRNNRSGADAITAHNGSSTDKGYVFEGCTIVSECDVVSLSRAWNYTPKVAFLNSLVDYSEGTFDFSDSQGKIQRWTKELMNANAWPVFGEYNTHLEDGTVLNPASNIVTFVDNKSGGATQNLETVLTADQAVAYSYANIFDGSWNPASVAQQVTADPLSIDADAAYLVEDSEGAFVALVKGAALTSYIGNYIRKANTRGGFGAKVLYATTPSALDPIFESSNPQIFKFIKDGHLIILRDGKTYTVLGQPIR